MSRTVVVTGATSGVGRAIARRFAAEGDQVALLARSHEALQATAEEIEDAGGEALVLPTDVADHVQVDEAATATEEAFGPIDVWVNDAMTTVFSFFEDIEPEEFQRATEVTYLGTVWGTKAALSRMVPRDRGVVIQVGSAMAYRGIPLQAPYCGAKHGIKGFTESVRTELRHKRSNVRVTMAQLPGLNTPQFDHCRSKFDKHPMPVPPIFQPEVAADAVHWLADHPRRRELYVGLPAVYTIVGSKLASAAMDRYLARSGVRSQLADSPPTAHNRPGNLFDTFAVDPGAHGPFDDQAHGRSVWLEVSKHRAPVLAGLAAGAVAATGLLARR